MSLPCASSLPPPLYARSGNRKEERGSICWVWGLPLWGILGLLWWFGCPPWLKPYTLAVAVPLLPLSKALEAVVAAIIITILQDRDWCLLVIPMITMGACSPSPPHPPLRQLSPPLIPTISVPLMPPTRFLLVPHFASVYVCNLVRLDC